MNKIKIWLPCLIIVLIAGAGAFFAGIKYGQSNSHSAFRGSNGAANFSQNANGQGNQRGARFGGNAGATMGDVISQDDKSVTLKLRDGGSKIIFFSDSTQIMKSTSGSKGDIQTGENLTVIGTANQDGSITAQSIQIRPAGQTPAPPQANQ